MKAKITLSLGQSIKGLLESQAVESSRNKSEHVKELVLAEQRRRERRDK